MFKIKRFLSVFIFSTLFLGLAATVYLSLQPRGAFELRRKAAELQPTGSILSFVGPSQVKIGDKFSVDVILDTTNDPDYTISGVDAVVSYKSAGSVLPTTQPLPTTAVSCAPKACPAYDLQPNFCAGGKIIYEQQSPANPCDCPPPPKCLSQDYTPVRIREDSPMRGDVGKPAGSYMPYYFGSPISLTAVSPGKIFDSYPKLPGNQTILPQPIEIGIAATNSGIPETRTRLDQQSTGTLPPGTATGFGGAGQGGTSSGTTQTTMISGTPTWNTNTCPAFPGCPPPGSMMPWNTCWGDAASKCPAVTGTKPYPTSQVAPVYGGNLVTISGIKNYSVNDQGNFQGFTGRGVFATLNFIAINPGRAEIKLAFNGPGASDDTNINGYLAKKPVAGQKTQDRLLAAPNTFVIDVAPQDSPTAFPPPPQITSTPITPIVSNIPGSSPTPTPQLDVFINFKLNLEGRKDHGILTTLYGMRVPADGTKQVFSRANSMKLGSVMTDMSGTGRLELNAEFSGRSYYLFADTPMHLRKAANNNQPMMLQQGENPKCAGTNPCPGDSRSVNFGTLTAGDIYVDANGYKDNIINSFDVAELYSIWSTQDLKVADLNGDGVINNRDLAILLNNFGKIGDQTPADTTLKDMKPGFSRPDKSD